MRAYDLILKKRNGFELTKDEIEFLISGYVSGSICDYQMSAFLMAVYFKGMSKMETLYMTNAVSNSGDIVDLSAISGIKVDKHSTGGVGDKTTLVIGPIAAAAGVKIAKMSGRGLSHTGGTVDKLESIENLKTEIARDEFFKIVNDIGIAVIGQSGNLAPADKKLYALRDVTATVDSIPLIAVSIMSKKLAAGSDAILLDVKTGSGAFMKTLDDSIKLAKEMVDIGQNAGKNTVALVTNMDIPLGNNIGNSLEVIEAIETLKGNGPEDLTQICIELATNMLVLAQKGTENECREMVLSVIKDGSALEKLRQMVKAQGGNDSVILDTNLFKKASITYELISDKEGYISKMDTEGLGIASSILGAGRETMESDIDHSAGIKIIKKTGDFIKKGDVLAVFYTNNLALVQNAQNKYLNSLEVLSEKPCNLPIIYAKVTKEDIIKY